MVHELASEQESQSEIQAVQAVVPSPKNLVLQVVHSVELEHLLQPAIQPESLATHKLELLL